MAGVNQVTLIGNLGADPELRHTDSGTAVATMSLATTRVYKDKNDKKQEETTWHRVVVWGKQAEQCNEFLSKGRQVYVGGRIQHRSYEKDGEKKYITEVVAERVQFLGKAPEGAGGGGNRDVPPPSDDDIPF